MHYHIFQFAGYVERTDDNSAWESTFLAIIPPAKILNKNGFPSNGARSDKQIGNTCGQHERPRERRRACLHGNIYPNAMAR